ncbi:MAG: hypothetical protein IJ298_02650 [Ruminococcus sp.]|nr:hypothetical protein [Ruminococcus sp.]
MKDDKRSPSRFPEEIPTGDNKKLDHGVIVDVVQNELCPPGATNPAKPADTDSLNTEFAKQAMKNNNQ